MRKLPITLCLLLIIVGWNTLHTEAESPPLASFEKSEQREAPMSLTTQDGTGLKLVELKAKAVIEGPLAFTELHLTFENPEDRELEGRFEITLADKAAISRLAMLIDDKWQEAEVVERQAARRAYEDFLHRRQDPALLEKEAGNEFRARIFPIPAKGRKQLIISYSQEMVDAEQPYRLPLQGLPRIESLDLEVRVGESQGKTLRPESVRIQRRNYMPEGDFVVPQPSGVVGLSSGRFVVARVAPELSAQASAPTDLLVLFDCSASRALGFESQVELLQELIVQLKGLEKVTVAAFDQTVEPVYQGSAADFDGQSLLDRRALGATDLAKALSWAARQQGHRRLLLVSDGISTAGESELIKTLENSELARLDVITVGGIRDKEKMQVLVEGALQEEGTVLDADLEVGELAERLSLSVTSGLDVQVKNADWVWPSTLNNIQPGDQRLVYAKLKQPSTTLELTLAQRTRTLALHSLDSSPLVTRSAVVAQIARLESSLAELTDQDDRKAVEEQIIALSTEHRVLSDKTALLVLETERDYERFGIDRKALADILVVGPQGLELRGRQNVVVAKRPKVVEKEADKSKKAGAAERKVPNQELALEESEQEAPEITSPPQSEPVATGDVAPPPEPRAEVSARISNEVDSDEDGLEDDEESSELGDGEPALTGKLAEITQMLRQGEAKKALAQAEQWQRSEPGNVLALIALGECLEALDRFAEAARVYGSIIDLFPSRADLRRYAGSRLQGLPENGLELAIDSFRKAAQQRADHVSSHRFLALALARQQDYEGSFEALEAGLQRGYPSSRFAGYQRILREDLGVIGSAWAAKQPAKKATIEQRLQELSAQMAQQPSLRFVLTWETDANDVDFHIHDKDKGHAYYSKKRLKSGGELFADVTTGYGPECFAIPGKPTAFPYRLQIHYYSRGPMGYGMGQLEILQHDGKGGLKFEQRPYVVMNDGAYVDLGIVEQPL